jgi:Ni2+-binding GTPase involved in maturation of urease and hydrogenase
MQLHIIGGFLGSGKTTAIIGAARYLASQGKKVGVITNDQGRHLVDTEIMRAEQLPAMQVSGGCFCCHLDDLNDRLGDLIDQHHPHVIFAESVGSCADVVATVVRPLLEMEIGAVKPNSYTVFADVRLLNRYLSGLEMPFSEGINYIFGKQIEEAGLLVINKTDLIDAGLSEDVIASAQRAYPRTDIIAASALNDTDIAAWVDALEDGQYPPPLQSLDIDYERYADGEGNFAWIDREYRLACDPQKMPGLVREIIACWVDLISENKWVSGHVKAGVTMGGRTQKISLAQSGDVIDVSGREVESIIAQCRVSTLSFLVNLLVEGDLVHIQAAMDQAISNAVRSFEADYVIDRSFERRPGFPKPTYRIH